MVDVHSFALPGFVSQATFALPLALLAWSDARTRGTRWLAAACALQLLIMISRAILPLPLRISENLSACLLVLVFFLIYMGMRWFVLRVRLATMNGPLALSAAMTTILSVGVMHPGAELAAARFAALIVLGTTIVMLLRPRIKSLADTARVMALLMIFVAATVALQLVLSLRIFPPDHQLDAAGHDLTMIGITMLGFAFIGMYVAETKRRLHEETRLDSLTGLHNRRAFEEMIQREVQLAARDNTPLTLLMMDLDHFKQLNDTWGHALGDRALRTFGGVLLTVTGTRDAVARLGGEEFAILLPGRSARSALSLAERLRATVEGLRLSEGEELVRFTVSVGLSSLQAGETGFEPMLRRADRALYKVKRSGRNRVLLADTELSPVSPIPPARVIPDLQPLAAGAAERRV
ncbi:MAG TPA: GGDEF domain-containing protein, partial [Acidobacteriaceae bacterium]|nr:GGDEF domain-containing protein [Acidobacteriaceae bacterium]